MKSFIRITRHPYEEPYHVNLVIAASNGKMQSELEIYANATDLTVLARELRAFPKRDNNTAVWELGSKRPEDRFAFYYRLRVYHVATNGRCAIELCFCNNQQPPDREVAEFSIEAFPSDLDRFASLLEQFSKLNHRVLEWSINDDEVR